MGERHPVLEDVGPLRLLPRQPVDRQPVAGARHGERRGVDAPAGPRVDVEPLGEERGDQPGALADARQQRRPEPRQGRSVAALRLRRRPGEQPAEIPDDDLPDPLRGGRHPGGDPGLPLDAGVAEVGAGQEAGAAAGRVLGGRGRAPGGPGRQLLQGEQHRRAAPVLDVDQHQVAAAGRGDHLELGGVAVATGLVGGLPGQAGDRLPRVDDAAQRPGGALPGAPAGLERAGGRLDGGDRGDRRCALVPGRAGHPCGSGVRRGRRRAGGAPSSARSARRAAGRRPRTAARGRRRASARSSG